MDHIKDLEFLFPMPCKLNQNRDNMSVGEEKTWKELILVKFVTGELELSKRYANHCVREKLVTMLNEQGYSNKHIVQYLTYIEHIERIEQTEHTVTLYLNICDVTGHKTHPVSTGRIEEEMVT